MTGHDAPMVGILSRVPRVGHGKSRLAAVVGTETAASLSQAFLLDIAEELGHDDRWASALFVEPRDACDEAAAMTGIDDTRPQPGGSIGSRMSAAVASLTASGARAVVIVGSDAPQLEAGDVAQALELLGRHDIVLGPATDGGYYLVGSGPAGLAEHPGALFADEVRWSTSTVLKDTEHIARSLGWSVAHLQPLTDVDTLGDLACLRRELNVRPGVAARTREVLRALDEHAEVPKLALSGGVAAVSDQP